MPRGIPNSDTGASSQTQRLIEAMRELEERIAVEKAKDRARALLLHFAQKHGLSAMDLRNAAKLLGDRKVGDAPVLTKQKRHGQVAKHMLTPAKGKIGKAIRAARLKLDMTDGAVADAVGCHSSMVGRWQRGVDEVAPHHQEKLVEVLKLPKAIFPAKALSNGHAAH